MNASVFYLAELQFDPAQRNTVFQAYYAQGSYKHSTSYTFKPCLMNSGMQ
ncbi:MAG: hypothetical protein JO323_21535 [Acidobacteriia bacterium]|nr:hypothetical protein [Terriglobia bacterium]